MDDIVGKTITVSVQVDNRQIVIDTVVSGVLSGETSSGVRRHVSSLLIL